MFAAVAEEVGTLFHADGATVMRYEPDGEMTVMGRRGVMWAELGERFRPHPSLAVVSVRRTGRAARP